MDEMSSQVMPTNRCKAVYTIVSRTPEKRIWVRVGTAWVNQDHSLNVKLDASPTNGELHIRDAEYNPLGRRSGAPMEARPLALDERAVEAAS